MYEVFINHHSLILSNSVAKSSYTQHDYNESFNWADFIKNIPQKGALKLWVKSDDLESSWRSFKAEFELILAAGGLVKKKQDFWVIDRINDQEDTSINLKEYHFTDNETRYITL